MNLVILLLIFGFYKITTGQSDEEIEYYETLINTEIENANEYKLPEDAKSYEGNYYTSDKKKDYKYYDFIIIGTGSTGSVLTARLSEVKSWNILALDAGGWENNFTDIPMFNSYLQFSNYSWGFLSTPQKTACLAMEDQRCSYPRGKAIGGSTQLHGLVYSRGNSKQFDEWNRLVDNGDWSYKDVLKYFKKSEDSHIDGDPTYHGVGGPLQVNYHTPNSPQYYAYLNANEELGRKIVDYNGETEFGVAQTQLNTINGRRLSAAKAFIFPALNRTNLHILPNSYVTKILIDKLNRAYGVEFMHNGKRSIAKARKEVILSGGVFGSPTILMHSGIGPKKELKSNDIPVKKNLPVGQNLEDHAAYHGLYVHTNYTEISKTMKEYIKEYLSGIGPYTIAANLQGIGFFETQYAKMKGVPDIEILFVPSNSTGSFARKALRITESNYNAAFNTINPQTDFKVIITLCQPYSNGKLTLKSGNVFDYPLINPNFLSDKNDLDIKTMLEGIKLVLRMLETKAFKKINASLSKVVFPACENYEYLSDDFWMCNIRQITFNIFHPIGTCKMGKLKDGAVVDGKLKVHGIKNLRIADTSIFPFSFVGRPNAPAMMIGEKLSDMLKTQYNKFKLPFGL